MTVSESNVAPLMHRCRCANVPMRGRHVSTLARVALGHEEERAMGLGMILLIVLVLMLVGAVPAWPHSRGWGYAPSGGLGLVVVVLVALLLLGHI